MAATEATSIGNLKGFNMSTIGSPILVMMILLMMVIPLAPFILDMLFTFNICLSMVVLLAVVYSKKPLDFAAFPTILLISTLLRLSLNVASTRIVLLNGHNGTDSAGQVIKAFGDFVVGGNYTVGFVVFIILVIINFVVITKGAGRISEVSARFTLDAMPGKQMAIDADLNSGLIEQEEAKRRRSEISQEADFYGAMDGASKFVKGDATAGIFILVINILGGLAIGAMQHGLSMSDAARIYTLLTIGDGLVAQIPSLLLSTSAAIMVTRVSSDSDMGEEIVKQLFHNPKTLLVTAFMIGAMGIIPGMPNVAFLLIAAACAFGAFWLDKQQQQVEVVEEEPEENIIPEERELSWDDIDLIDSIGLEVGYRLIPMVDKNQNGQLLSRIKGVRKKLSQELGFLLPSIHIRDNLDLEPNSYRITIKDTTIAKAEVQPGRELAINPGHVFGELPGPVSTDPVFGLEAVWIDIEQRDQSQSLGYTVVDSSTVVATHLSQVLQEHAYELLGHKEVQKLLEQYEKNHPKVLEDIVPKVVTLGTIVRVLQNLLKENIPIRDLNTIFETLIEHTDKSQNPDVLTSLVRVSLGRLIIERIVGEESEIPVITLDNSLEQLLQKTYQSIADGSGAIEPGLAQKILGLLKDAAERQEVAGQPAILLVPDTLREMLARFVKQNISRMHVLSYSEIPDGKQIKFIASVGGTVDE